MASALIEADFEFKELDSSKSNQKNAMNEMWEKHISERNNKRLRNSPENEKYQERETRLRREVKGYVKPSI